jgi:hypothetical protein
MYDRPTKPGERLVTRDPKDSPISSTPADALFETALSRLRRRATAAASGAALMSGAAQLPLMIGCAPAEEPLGTLAQDSWSQNEGQRNTEMVSFTGETWSVCKYPNTRFGCGSVDVYVKLRVRPVAGADLDWKRVGVTYRTPYDTYDRTAIGTYVGTLPGGDEEWHVPVNVPSSSTVIVFDAWYQDGAYHTYVDDNQGEFHVANAGAGWSVVRVEPWLNTVVVDDAGVHGRISLQLADLDFDKEVVLIGTTDGWNTVIEMGMGQPGQVNRWTWTEDFPWSGYERWQIDVDLPCTTDRFEFAVAYRHGVKNGAKTYEFWDNNFGQNYIVERAVP